MNEDLQIAKKTVKTEIIALKKLSASFKSSSQFTKAVNLCSKTKNKIVVVGVGKSFIEKYKKKHKLYADYIGRGGAWLDTGSIEDFYKTSAFVSAIENRQGFKISCIEEIALNNKWIGSKNIKSAIKFYGKCQYSEYLKKLI